MYFHNKNSLLLVIYTEIQITVCVENSINCCSIGTGNSCRRKNGLKERNLMLLDSLRLFKQFGSSANQV